MEFTKEQLISAAQARIDYLEDVVPNLQKIGDDLTLRLVSVDLSLVKIAMGVLTAEPKVYASQETLAYAEQGEALLRTLGSPSGDCIIPLYRLPELEKPNESVDYRGSSSNFI